MENLRKQTGTVDCSPNVTFHDSIRIVQGDVHAVAWIVLACVAVLVRAHIFQRTAVQIAPPARLVSNTPVLEGMEIFHNYDRLDEAINGRTPSEAVGIKVDGETGG